MTVDVDRLRELSDAILIEKHFGGDVSARLSDDRDYEDELRPRLRELMDYLEDNVEE